MAIPKPPKSPQTMTKDELLTALATSGRERSQAVRALAESNQKLAGIENSHAREINDLLDRLMELERKVAEQKGYIDRVKEYDHPTPRQEVEQTISYRYDDMHDWNTATVRGAPERPPWYRRGPKKF